MAGNANATPMTSHVMRLDAHIRSMSERVEMATRRWLANQERSVARPAGRELACTADVVSVPCWVMAISAFHFEFTMVQFELLFLHPGHQFQIVGGDEYGHAHLIELIEQRHNLAREFRIEVASRLIGK